MILKTSIPSEANKAVVYLNSLIEKGETVEVKKIPKRRTIKQNRYVHKLFTLAGSHFGYSTIEMKSVFKQRLGYTYEKQGRMFEISTADMDTKELTDFISQLRNLSASEGKYLPTPDEYGENYAYFEEQIERAIAVEKKYSY